jgi:prepilin peptidase CpaA
MIAILLSVTACVTDLRTGRIPNWLTLPVVGTSPILFAILQGRTGAMLSLIGLLLAGAVPWLLYRSTQGRGIGGGDVKLFAALGALLGPTRGLEIQLTAFGLLALFAFIVLAYRGQLLRLLRNTLQLATNPFLPRDRRRPIEAAGLTEIRMGPSIALAVVANSALTHLHRFVPWLA